jgi:hypothetical protein
MTGTACIRVRTAPEIELLCRIPAGTPRLPGALCVGRSQLFDGLSSEDIATAKALCARCSSLQHCAAWVDAQPRDKLAGVIAGRDIGRSTGSCLHCGTPLHRNRRWCPRRCQDIAKQHRRHPAPT